METLTHCPLCDCPGLNSDFRVVDHHLSKEVFTISHCTRCGFRFTNPRPDTSELGHYYASNNYISHSNNERGIIPQLYYFARSIALRSKSRIITRLSNGKTLLDYGCGAGAFLAYMRANGYTVEGVEPGDAARKAAQIIASCPVHASLDRVTHARFSVVTLWHVLEHVKDPGETLGQLAQRLTPDGVLLVAVPDLSSWDAEHYGPLWAALDVPRHLSHFRPKDIDQVAQRNRLYVAARRRLWFDAPYISLLSERYSGRGTTSAMLLGLAKGGYSNLISLFTGRSTSSTLYVLKHEKKP